MHVAYIHQHFSTRKGVTGTRSYEMSQRLIAAGHRVTMVCGTGETSPFWSMASHDRVTELDVDGIRVMCVREPYANRMSFARRVMAFARFARSARKIVSQLDADLVFATSTPLTVGVPGMKAARSLGVPFVFEVRDLWPDLPIALGVVKNPLLKLYLRRLEKRIYFAARHIIALAPGIRRGITATGYPDEQVSTIPNSSDLELFRPDDSRELDECFGAPDDFRLVFTGAHGLANGLEAVLDAAVEIKRRGVSGIRFCFIGGGGLKCRLVRMSLDKGVDDIVTWMDPIPKDELARIIPRMDVGIMALRNVPQFRDGTSPNKFFDYISCGLPVLNNYPGWIADHIKHRNCGLVVEPDNPAAFADAVIWMRCNRDKLRLMGQAARQLAEDTFSRDILGGQFVEVIEKVFANR